ncbi:hypothetical protein AAG747_05315 [Rapidithrix thailandica]|uniref:SH3 domain-containing protein n=1 Tax=Rapidithrix thailandica TaxID=413964 RepID=A0AAW9S8S9_9BACT
MRKSILLFLISIFFHLSVSAQNNCEQTFNFFLKAQFNDLFWIGESRGGECKSSKLIQILVKENQEVDVIDLMLQDYNNWYWVESAEGYLRRETVVHLESKGKNFVDKGTRMKVYKPKYNTRLWNIFHQEFPNHCGEAWNNAMGNDGIDLPRIGKGKDLELVYYHPQGMYFNYEIQETYYFPDSKYLVVITGQEQKCANFDTMHGFLILKVKN